MEVSNGAEALLRLLTETANLIILDLHTLVVDGRSSLEYRLPHTTISKIPVLMVSSWLQDAARRQVLLHLWADRLLKKPVDPADLLGGGRQALATSRIPEDWFPLNPQEASRRQNARVAFPLPIWVRAGSAFDSTGCLRDLSAGGLGACAPRQLHRGETITVHLNFEVRSGALRGVVQWTEERFTPIGYPHGIEFAERQRGAFALHAYAFFCQQAKAPS